MIGLVFNILTDLFLLLFPFLFISREIGAKISKPKGFDSILTWLGLKAIPLKEFAVRTLILFIAITFSGLLLSWLFSIIGISDLENVSASILDIWKNAPLFLVYLLVVRVVAEEIFFRGFLVKKWGILVSTVLFALAHAFYYSFVEVAGAFVLGLILAIGFKKGGNLFPVIATHFLYNLLALGFMTGVF